MGISSLKIDLMSREVLVRSGNNATAEEASTAWIRRFGAPHVKLRRGLPDPLDVGKRLGSGGVGEVWATTIGGVPIALKRIYATHLTEAIFAEVKIMRQMAEKRHHHIVQLIGSYEKRHTNISELGLLIWPVAICDLAALLHDIDIAHSWYVHGPALAAKTSHDEEDVVYAIEALAKFESGMMSPGILTERSTAFLELYDNTLNRLQKSIGCIASAVAWLHDCQIRHKDLKPSQILISTSGVWLSDFGWSKDVSEMTCSTTVGGKTTTPKYLAPERALNQPCGRPEDLFSLGCIFLEIGYQLFRSRFSSDYDRGPPWFESGWLFSAHVEDAVSLAQDVMHQMVPGPLAPQASLLLPLVVRMLDRNPARRPLIAEVVANLTTQPGFSGHCCRPTKSRSSDTDTKASTDNVMSGPSELADHQLNSSDHLTSISSVESLFEFCENEILHPDVGHGSYETLFQESSRASVTGQKRSWTQASPDHMSDLLPRKRIGSDTFSPYHRYLPSLFLQEHAISSESTQPVDHHKDMPEIEIYRNLTDHWTHLPPPTTEGTQLPSINELLHLREGEPNSVSPYITYTLAPVEARTESPHRLSTEFPNQAAQTIKINQEIETQRDIRKQYLDDLWELVQPERPKRPLDFLQHDGDGEAGLIHKCNASDPPRNCCNNEDFDFDLCDHCNIENLDTYLPLPSNSHRLHHDMSSPHLYSTATDLERHNFQRPTAHASINTPRGERFASQ